MRYGIRQPKEETPETIQAFLDKMNYPNENMFLFKDSISFYYCLRDSLFRTNVFGTLFFCHGRLMNHYKDTVYHTDPLYRVDHLMEHLIPLNGSTKIDTCGADYLAVVTWGRFLGKYNERLFSVRKSAEENKFARVKTIFLCLDMQKEWNLPERGKNVLRFE